MLLAILSPGMSVILLLVALTVAAYLLAGLRYELSEKEEQLESMQELIKQAEERVDSIFIQIIKWQMITTEYRALLGGMIPILNIDSLSEAWEVLEKKISAVHLITETDRKLYKEELMKKSENNEDMDEMIELLAIKLRRKGIQVNASDSPDLTSDRQN